MKRNPSISSCTFMPPLRRHSSMSKHHMIDYDRTKRDSKMVQAILNMKSSIMTEGSMDLRSSAMASKINLNKAKRQLAQNLKQKQIETQNRKLLDRIEYVKERTMRQKIKNMDCSHYQHIKGIRKQFRKRVRQQNSDHVINQNEKIVKRLVSVKSQYRIPEGQIKNQSALTTIESKIDENRKISWDDEVVSKNILLDKTLRSIRKKRCKTELSQIYLKPKSRSLKVNSKATLGSNPETKKEKLLGKLKVELNIDRKERRNHQRHKDFLNRTKMNIYTHSPIKQAVGRVFLDKRSSKQVILCRNDPAPHFH